MSDYLAHLNPAQREAVTTIDGPLLVIAGAGSGKTRVIEYRTLHLVQCGVNPREILLLTFTRRAAGEMLERATRHNPQCRFVHGGTFHSFAYQILRREGSRIGLDSFTVLDEGDTDDFMKRCLRDAGIAAKSVPMLKPGTLKAILAASRAEGETVRRVLEQDYDHLYALFPVVEEVIKAYTRYKRAKQYLDYDDLLFSLQDLLADPVCGDIALKYRYLMVDEYQDTNAVQGKIVERLGQSHRNVMAVGDDAQSIYAFRGATHENIMRFQGRFPGCRLVKLEENYRSTQAILDLGNAVLENMTSRYEKRLSAARAETGTRPALLVFPNSHSEALWIVGRAQALERGGVPFRDQAILFRSSFVSIPLQTALLRVGIPFRIFGGLRFSETAHVRDVVAHLRVAVSFRDEIAWNRVLLLLEGIGVRSSGKILEAIREAGSFEEALQTAENRLQGKSVAASRALIEGWREVQAKSGSVENQLRAVLNYYEPLMQFRFDDWPGRLRDLDALRGMGAGYHTLQDFIADITLELPKRQDENQESLTLSTIHSAKGLEWEAVFFIGLGEGVLPSGLARNEDEIEEEHRLFYVGITRAKRFLTLTFSDGGGAMASRYASHELSRFLTASNVLSSLETPSVLGIADELF